MTAGTLLLTDAGAFRYGLTESGQMIIQLGGGRGGQAIVDNYLRRNVGFEEVQNGNITVMQLKSVNGASLSEIKATITAILNTAGLFSPGTDPLVLDLDGDGVELVRLESSSTYFDLDNDSFAERTAWVRPDDGLLARDINGNGRWDADPGIKSQGGANDVTRYTVWITYPRLFAASAIVGGEKTNTVSSSTILKNQPYRVQQRIEVKSICT